MGNNNLQITQVRKTKRRLKRMMLYVITLLILVGVSAILVIKLNPAFGGNLSNEQEQAFKKYANFVDGRFVNLEETSVDMGASDFLSMMKDSVYDTGEERSPKETLPVAPIDWNKIDGQEDSLTWLGHSAFLVSLDHKKVLVDPMLSSRSSPLPSISGSKRFTGSLLDLIDGMPSISAVLITHDHYDHLDYPSIMKLKDKTNHFFVPLGVSNHLIRWGIPKEKITELNWWDESNFDGLKIVLTPSRHNSGRGILNRNTTLWGGWVILGQQTRFFTSGDGGYGQHFKEIGQKYGPFDVALIEGAQYDRRWPTSHMVPEQSVQASKDIKANHMMLIHWAGFSLAYHGWKEPIERAIRAAKNEKVQLFVPRIGETVVMNPSELSVPIVEWWKEG